MDRSTSLDNVWYPKFDRAFHICIHDFKAFVQTTQLFMSIVHFLLGIAYRQSSRWVYYFDRSNKTLLIHACFDYWPLLGYENTTWNF